MALDPDLVAFTAKLIADEPMDSGQIDELARVLENREELFAYLLTNPKFLQKHPEVQAEVSRLARENGQGAATRRRTMGPPAVVQGLVTRLQQDILARIAGETDRESTGSEFDQVDSQVVRYTSAGGHREASPERWIRR